MFQHFHAGDMIEGGGVFFGQLFGADVAVFDAGAGFLGVEFGHGEQFLAEINA